MKVLLSNQFSALHGLCDPLLRNQVSFPWAMSYIISLLSSWLLEIWWSVLVLICVGKQVNLCFCRGRVKRFRESKARFDKTHMRSIRVLEHLHWKRRGSQFGRFPFGGATPGGRSLHIFFKKIKIIKDKKKKRPSKRLAIPLYDSTPDLLTQNLLGAMASTALYAPIWLKPDLHTQKLLGTMGPLYDEPCSQNTHFCLGNAYLITIFFCF